MFVCLFCLFYLRAFRHKSIAESDNDNFGFDQIMNAYISDVVATLMKCRREDLSYTKKKVSRLFFNEIKKFLSAEVHCLFSVY